MKNQWHFIVNPISGKGKGLDLWHQIKPLLGSNGIAFSYSISKFHKHIIDLVVEKHNQGIRNFVGIGGDGTINEILNGVFTSKENGSNDLLTICLLPVGTGNDWVRNHKEKLSVANIVSKLKACKTDFHDIGTVTLGSTSVKRYFINVAGAGIDGRVVQELKGIGANKNKVMYIKSLLKSLTQFIAPRGTISVDNEIIFTGKSLLIAASKGQYFGGGMHISPNASSNNGKLDITLVKKDSHFKVFPQLYKLFNGKIATASFVEKHQGKTLKAEFSTLTPVQADGEFIGEAKVVEFKILENFVRVLV